MDPLDTINLIMNDNTSRHLHISELYSHTSHTYRAAACSNKLKDYKQRRKYDHDQSLCYLSYFD